ncbi:hypothetical protein Tco_1094098 [Tanacetum coccineum]|uniref:Xylulose kinase-1 n=1 Tax=Tanacetum coccineum TaxID=301880 RepID=A0ABQ5IFT6_9ASTR
MEALKFVDSHNVVAYLEKSTENANFDEIVDFLNANPIRYALTVSPTIYVSYIEQFWSTTKIKIVNNERQICAKVNGKTIKISESSMRRDLQFNDEDDKTVYEERGDSMERATTTAASLDAEQDSGNIIRTQSIATLNEPIPQETGSGSGLRRQDTILGDRPAQTRFVRLSKQSNHPPLSGVNTPGSGEDILKTMELIEICTKLSDKVLALENVKTAQDLEITSLKKRDIDDTTTSAPITTASVSVSTVEPSTPTTTTLIEDEDLTIAQTLIKMRSEKSKEKAKERGSKEKSSEPATRLTRGVTMQEPSESGIRKTVPPSQHDLKDKGKAKMIEPEKP